MSTVSVFTFTPWVFVDYLALLEKKIDIEKVCIYKNK